MTIAICEDESRDLMKTSDLVNVYFKNKKQKITIYSYCDADVLLAEAAQINFDIIVMDIYLPGVNGIQAARSLKKLNPDCSIIFVTSSSDFALEAFGIGAVHYIVKPVSEEELQEALERCCERKHMRSKGEVLEIMVDRRSVLLFQNCIRYIECQEKALKIYTGDGEYDTWSTLKKIEDKLNWEKFLKVQRSYIVNMDYIADVRGGHCVLRDGTTIKNSRNYTNYIREQYKRYLFKAVRSER